MIQITLGKSIFFQNHLDLYEIYMKSFIKVTW